MGSRSSKAINVKSLKAHQQLVLRQATSLCLSASAKRANSGKILWGYPSLTPACEGLLESRRSGLELLKSNFNAKNFIWRLSAQFTLKLCVAVQNREKINKTPILGFKIVDLDVNQKGV